MKTIRRISTDSIETALEQLVRSRTSGTKASISPTFVMAALKELLHWRHKDRVLESEVEHLFGDNLILIESINDSPLRVIEVGSLSDLGNSSHSSGCDLREIEWKKPEEVEPEETEPEELDESDVTYDVPKRPVLRSKRSGSGMHVKNRWEDGHTTRRVIILTLLVIIALTFIPVVVLL